MGALSMTSHFEAYATIVHAQTEYTLEPIIGSGLRALGATVRGLKQSEDGGTGIF